MTHANAWQTLFDEYIRIVRGVGDVVRDAERLMIQAGFESVNPMNTVGTESSLHMELPEKWAPGWFARFYGHKAKPTIYAYVAIFLHDRAGTEDFAKARRLTDPLIVAGVVRSASNEPCDWRFWHAKYWFWTEGATPDGPSVSHKLDKNKYKQAVNDSFAVRLERVNGLNDLQELVIDPLVKLVG